MKLFSETVNQNSEDFNSENNNEKINEYDQEVSEEQIENFQGEIVEKIEDKANELNISKEKLIELADLNLESLSAKNLKSLDLKKGGLEFIRDSVDRVVNEFWRSEKTGKLVTGTTSKIEGSINEAFEFAKKHKKIVSLGELALYASSFGPAILKDLAGDMKVDVYGEKISLKDLADNPELTKENKKVDTAYATLCGLQETYDAPINENFKYDGYILSVDSEIHLSFNSKESKELIHISFEPDDEKVIKISNETQKILREIDNISQVEFKESPSISMTEMTVNEFLENKEKIIDIISENLNAPREEVKKFIENVYIPNSSNISVVDFNDFKINKELPKNSKFENLKNTEATYYDFEDIDKFEDLFLDILEKEGYTIEKLKKIAQDNPEEVILIMSEVINKNLEYDYDEWKEAKSGQHWEDIKTPYEALSSGRAICYAYSSVFISAKHILEEKEIPHFDKFVALGDGAEGHAWDEIVTVNQEGNLDVSHIDLTNADGDSGLLSKLFNSELTKEKLNTDGKEFNSKYSEYIEEEHKTTFLDKIENYKVVCFQENLKKILTQYDPKTHKEEQAVKVNKKAFEEITKKKKGLSREDKKKAVNSLP